LPTAVASVALQVPVVTPAQLPPVHVNVVLVGHDAVSVTLVPGTPEAAPEMMQPVLT